MKLSCITTVFNEGTLLRTSIESVLTQSYGDFEYLVVDDGSSDETRGILAEFQDDRLRVIRQANDGLSSARNRALSMATGDYVCFLDADDSRPVWAFDAIVRELRRSDPDLMLCRGILSETDDRLGPFYDDAVLSALASASSANVAEPLGYDHRTGRVLSQLAEPQSANKVIRTSMIRDRHLGFPNTQFFEDIYFHTLAIASARRIAYCESPCFTYFRRYSKAQITGARDTLRFDVIAVVRMTLTRFAEFPQIFDPLHRTAVLLSCFKLLLWSEETVSHHHKFHFREMVKATLCLVDPIYLELPVDLPAVFDTMDKPRAYFDSILSDPRVRARQSRGARARPD